MNKRADIEGLRLLSAFGIVWFHAGPSGLGLAYSGLVAFLVLSMALGGRSGAPDAATVQRRALRLLRPWLVWFGIYAAFNVARGLPALPLEHGLLAGVLAGPSIHLWYLPFVFGALLAVDVLRAHLALRTLAGAAFVLALAVMASAPWWRPATLGLSYPALQWADALAPALAGAWVLGAGLWPRRVALGMAGALVLTATGLAAFEWVGTPYAVGLAASLFVLLRLPGPALAPMAPPTSPSTSTSTSTSTSWAPKLAPLTDCAFGIYLSHSLVYALLLQHSPALSARAMPVAVFALAWAATWALRRALPRVAACLS